ncbi:sensor histidine kinase [Anaerocolumna xylanovorans]|uniref:histidine kinase n=1 Tax=Anaerocolumna xylanovorans DSM 12503 TaxID=1121345 RepID=A0A1M7YN04_9FIRM|nr:HAMP domain-containing sensor histidine kinase [Anaerocolumna xylanovorans]SHO54000.1 hypothetical protein SAMN02745217_04437 [Anaerocolumna xylanovorans DSM 12503]
MIYLGIGLCIIGIIPAVTLFTLIRALKSIIIQMDEIEEQPEENRQLKSPDTSRYIEKLLIRINCIYQSRQQERIHLQRREKGIRSEIENISHDLRTPLTSILGYLDLLQDKDVSEAEKAEYLEIIGKRARGLKSLIENFYDLSRMEGESYPITLTVVLVQAAIRETVLAFYREFEEKGIQVTVELEEKEFFVAADKVQFNRILTNLIQNALKFSNSFFEIRQESKDSACCIQFRNDQKDMKEEDLDLIFNRFYTGDATRSRGSSGLGLTIAKLLAEKQKASISAWLEEGVFVIELQLKGIINDMADSREK